MIKIFNSEDRNFASAGNIIIEPIKCNETHKKSLNGWYIDVEVSIKYKEYIEKDKLCVIQTKSKLNPQAFRIGDNIEYTTNRIKFKANHVMFDSRDYVLVDVRPTNQNGSAALNYINERTDNVSPFSIYSNVEHIDTAYFIRKSLFEAWETIETRWNGFFDADNWNISFLTSLGNDKGAAIIYGKNMEGFEIYEDWSNVCTKIYPVGYDGIMLPEKFILSDVQYDKPYSRVVEIATDLEYEEMNESALIEELRHKANAYIKENKFPKVSYTINSNIDQELEIGDTVKVLHPHVELNTEVLEYVYNTISKKTVSLTFGNYSRDVQRKFSNIKNTINSLSTELSKQEAVINNQTILINTLNKNGYVYIDDNEILILDALPKESARNVWRFGMAGIGFSSNGYEGPFETAITMDGKINANFITTGTMSVSRIEGLANQISEYNRKIAEINIELGKIESSISDIADITITQESNSGRLMFENINQSEPIRIEISPLGDNISYLYPFEHLYPSNNLFIKLRTLRFTNTDTNEFFYYELPEDLLYYDPEHYDKFVLDYDSQTVYINKKCAYDNNGDVILLAEEVIHQYAFPQIELTDGDYIVEILKYRNTPYEAYLFCRLMAKNIYTTQFATRAEMHSNISQTAKQITSTVEENYATKVELNEAKTEIKQTTDSIETIVSKKVGNNEIISKINQSAETITIDASKFNINGTVSANGNFKVNLDGTIECVHAKVSGEINASTGKIGGFNIGEHKISNDTATTSVEIRDGSDAANNFFLMTFKKVNGNWTTPFYVTADGLLKADNADIKGSISGSTITGSKINLDAGSSANPNFKIGDKFYIAGDYLHMGDYTMGGNTVEIVAGSNQPGMITVSGSNSQSSIEGSRIVTPTVIQTSKESVKKNIELYCDNALDIIKNSEIYKYNFKSEKDIEKKHIGFVIGDNGGNYKTPEEVISLDMQGIDNYTMTSILWKAVQEQQELIEELQKKIADLEVK